MIMSLGQNLTTINAGVGALHGKRAADQAETAAVTLSQVLREIQVTNKLLYVALSEEQRAEFQRLMP
jgi:hypothetical protein